MVAPSGAMATAATRAGRWAGMGPTTGFPSPFQKITMPSASPVTMTLPSADEAMAWMKLPCSSRSVIRRPPGLP